MAKRKVVEYLNGEVDSAVCLESVGKLYLNGDTADVRFLIKGANGHTEHIPAHKLLLTAASKAFHQMFYGEIKEEGDVTIVDASAAGFKEFLQCFYISRVKLTLENINEVMYLSEKYGIDKCMAACSEFLQRKLTANEVMQAHQLAILFKQSELKKACEEFISIYIEEVLKSDGFLAWDKAKLCEILKMDKYSCPETVVFEACMSWVKHASQQEEVTKEHVQAHLGDLFYQIRYRSMTSKQFASLLSSYGHLFSGNECKEILQLVENDEYQPSLFTGKHRMSSDEWNTSRIIKCNRHDGIAPYAYSVKNVESTTFSVNKPLLFGRMMCYIRDRNKEPLINHRVGVTITRNPVQN